MLRLPKHIRWWMSALIDGEGTVMLVRHAPGAAALARMPSVANSCSYRPRVGIYNTDRRLMNAVVLHTGIDRVYEHKIGGSEHRKNHAKVAYEWRVNATECRWLLPQLVSTLVLKREQATLLLEVLALKEQKTPVKGQPWTHLADTNRTAVNERIVAIAAEMNLLNRKGRTA